MMKYNCKEGNKHPFLKLLEENNLLEPKELNETENVEEWCNKFCEEMGKSESDALINIAIKYFNFFPKYFGDSGDPNAWGNKVLKLLN